MDSKSFLETPLGNSKVYEIVDQNVRVDLALQLQQLWGVNHKGNLRFPGPNPVSIERKHLPLLKTREYLVGEKTDGVRYFLFCTKYDDKNLVLLVDRKLAFFLVPINLFEGVYDGTILDMELVKGETWMANVFDLVALRGSSFSTKHFPERFEAAREFMKMVFPSDKDPFVFQTKAWYPMQNFAALKQFTKTVKYKTDGYIFMPVREPVRCFRHETLFKWKPRLMNTVDFKLDKKDTYTYTMSVFNGKDFPVQDYTFSPSILHVEVAKMMKDTGCCIVESAWDLEKGLWVPKGVRRDKQHANDLRTFEGTLLNIREDIREQEFM